MTRSPEKASSDRWRSCQAGRTVVEVLVAIAIASIVGVGLSSMSLMGVKFTYSSRYEDERVYPVRNAFDMIVKELRLAQTVIPNCDSKVGFTMLAPGASAGWVVAYEVDAQKRLIRNIYTDGTCTAVSSTKTLAYQITAFSLSHVGSGQFELEMRATSSDAAGTEFVMTQRVIGRVAGQ